MLRALAVLIGAVVWTLAAGCLDRDGAPELGRVVGTVTSLDLRAPVAGARVFLVDASTNAPSSAPAETDNQGRYAIEAVPAGWLYIVVSHERQFLYHQVHGPLRVAGGRTVREDLFVASYPFLDPDGTVVRGVVVDAVSGEPIPEAYVSIGSTDMAALFSGMGRPWETITDRRGEFFLTGVPIKFSPVFQPVGVYPLVAVARGYLPGGTGSARRGEWLPLPAPGDTVRAVIRLEPGRGTARVSGRLVSEGRPVAGVEVCLTLVDTTASPAASQQLLSPLAVIPDLVAQSDAAGHFEIGRVPPGHYRVQAAYLPDDGWIAVPEEDNLYMDVRDLDIGGIEIEVLPAITALSPAPGATVHTGQPTLSWKSLAGADVYRIAFSAPNSFLLTSYEETTDTMIVMPPGIWGDGDRARWAVYGYRSGRIIGGTETFSSFQVSSR